MDPHTNPYSAPHNPQPQHYGGSQQPYSGAQSGQQSNYGYQQPQDNSANTAYNPYASAPQRPHKELTRSPNDRWLGGVCGGLAEYVGWSSGIVRLLFVLSIIFPGPQLIYYIAAWIIVPMKGENALEKFKL